MKAVAIVVAAGSGERLGADRPKAFVLLAGRPMLEWSLDALAAAGIEDVVVAVPPAPHVEVPLFVDGPLPRLRQVAGGATRSASVRAALAAAPPSDAIVVHDAARPLVPSALFGDCLAALDRADAAVAAARVADTVKEAGDDGYVSRTLDRSRLWAIQTPQAFRRDVLERALDQDDAVLAAATDDAWLVERSGGKVAIVEGPPANFKITTSHDLRVAELLLSSTC